MYSPESAAIHIWEIQPCKGDMNNDGVTNFRDINPFSTALSNPEVYGRDLFPGLGAVAAPWDVGGSRVYHGDINGDGLFNFGDINPFVILLSEGGCGPEEGGGEMMMEAPEAEAEEQESPEAMAAALTEVVPPEGYADLLGLVGFAINNAPDEVQSAYWLVVYGALTE